MSVTFYYPEAQEIKKIIKYIDERFDSREHGDSYWVDHCGERITTMDIDDHRTVRLNRKDGGKQ